MLAGMRTLAPHAANDLRAGNLELVPVRTPQEHRLLLYGELDVTTAQDLLGAARDELLQGATTLTLDLGSLDFLDSTGLGAVLQIASICDQRGVPLVLLSPRRNARRLLAMAGVSERLVIRDA